MAKTVLELVNKATEYAEVAEANFEDWADQEKLEDCVLATRISMAYSQAALARMRYEAEQAYSEPINATTEELLCRKIP